MKPLSILAAAVAAFALSAHAAVGNLADVSIVDRATGRALPVHWHEGRAYVVGKPGSEYQVTARNKRGEDLLAVVSVDGVNVLSGETASPDQAGYILNPWTRLDIKGWRKSLEETASFYFTSLGDSYAARTGRPAHIGVIGVALFRRAQPNPPLAEAAPAPKSTAPWLDVPQREKAEAREPKDSAMGARRHSAPSAPLGTGHGRREESPVRYTQFERATHAPAETIAIYYDSYRNLIAQGVIASPSARRDPDPFPSRFVPDPPR